MVTIDWNMIVNSAIGDYFGFLAGGLTVSLVVNFIVNHAAKKVQKTIENCQRMNRVNYAKILREMDERIKKRQAERGA